MEKFFKLLASVGIGMTAASFHKYVPVFICVCVGVILDVLTGLVRAKARGEKISSQKSTKGFFKKLAYFLALLAGLYIDTLVVVYADIMTFKLPFASPFTMIIGCYISLTEAISICENILKTNPDVLPKWIVNLLEGSKKNIENKKEEV